MAPLPDRRADLESRRRRLLDMAEAGALELLELPELRVRLARLDAERTRADAARLVQEAALAAARPEARAALLGTVEGLRDTWATRSPAQRREVLDLLAERIAIGPEGLLVAWRPVAELSRELGY